MELNGNAAFDVLSQGFDVSVVIGMKTIFEKIIEDLDLHSPPVFTTIDCGNAGIRVGINLNVSNLPSQSAQRSFSAFVEGDTMINYSAAEVSAIKKALIYLKQNHLIRISDFSSMVVDKVEANSSSRILPDAIAALEKVLAQWQLSITKCEQIESNLDEKQCNVNVSGHCTSRGTVYGFLTEYLAQLRSGFYQRTTDANMGLIEAKNVLARYQNFHDERSVNAMNNPSFRDIRLPTKFILQYVMSFYGFENPQYVTIPQCHGFVKSNVVITFPEMDDFQFGGRIQLSGHSYSSAEANEEAAYEALLFIEENFHTKVVDYNYSMRKKSLNDEKTLRQKLSNILDLAESVKQMFGQLVAAIEGKSRQFRFDPSIFSPNPISSGQINAYRFCSNTLIDLQEYTQKSYKSCADEFDVLNKITWKFFDLKNNSPM